MPDPILYPRDFLSAELVVDHLVKNLAIHFQIEGDKFDREMMQKHLDDRLALIATKRLLLDAGLKLINSNK